MKKTSTLVVTLCEIGIFAAFGFILDEIQGNLFKGIFLNGGSIGIAMIAVLIVAYRRGLWPALLTGLIMGLFDIATSAYIIHPVQLLLDYILPYALVGFVGLLKPLFIKNDAKSNRIIWLIAGAFIGGLLKFASHYLAGVIYWANPKGFVWGLENMNVYLYCFVYNIAFIGPSIILCGAALVFLYLKAPQILVVKEKENNDEPENDLSEKEEKNPLPFVYSTAAMAFGTFVFAFYLIKYITSFASYTDDGAFGYDFDTDSMLIFILGLALALLGTNSLIKHLKDKFSYVVMSGVLTGILFVSLAYGISRLVKIYVKGKGDPTVYWIWFVIGLVSFLGGIAVFIVALIKSKKKKS